MTAPSDALAAQIRPLLAGRSLVEKPMFGGVGFMLRGNMAVGTTAKGDLLVRADPARHDELLGQPGAYQMHMGPRVMTGFIAVEASGRADTASLGRWLEDALAYAETLPPK